MNNNPIYIDLEVEESVEEYDIEVEEINPEIDIETSEQIVVSASANYGDGLVYDSAENLVSIDSSKIKHIYYDTEENWRSQNTLISELGALYVYKDHSTVIEDGVEKYVPAIKIGDGTSYLIDMPFINDDFSKMLLEHLQDAVVHVSDDDRTFWNNKSSAYMDPDSNETLVLSNTNILLGGIIKNYA